jgi:hypothetical protein
MWAVATWALGAGVAPSTARGAELLLAQPAACAIGDELAFRVELALGQPLATAADVRCTIHIERQGPEFAARLELGAPGARERSFRAPTCEKLTETLALAVVLAVGEASHGASGAAIRSPSSAEIEGVDSNAPDSNAGPVNASLGVVARASGADSLESAPVPDPSATQGVRWGARAALVLDAGTLPAPAFGALLGASLGGALLEGRLLGTFLLPRDVSIDSSGPESRGAELGFAAGSLLGCAPRLLRSSRLELGACAGAELGWHSGQGTGLTVSRRSRTRWLAARADVGGRWGLGPRWLGLDLWLSGLLPLERSRFVISDEGDAQTVHRTGAVEVRTSVGIDVQLD